MLTTSLVPRFHGSTCVERAEGVRLHDVPPEVLASRAEEQRPETDAIFTSPCEFVWPNVPITVIAGADDPFFPLDFRRRVARDRLNLEPVTIPGGHLVALSNPAGLAEQLLAAASP